MELVKDAMASVDKTEKKPIEIQLREEVTQEPAVEEVQIEEQNVNLGNTIETPKLIENISNKENIERTYKISGYIWEDNNQAGIRGNGEGKIDDYNEMTVRLVNAESGVIEAETSPDEIGYYVFQGVKNGNHYIVLNYNTRKYGITTYSNQTIDIYPFLCTTNDVDYPLIICRISTYSFVGFL